jgi:drug/metabolite transporter (DMT)-like permease
MLWLPFLLFGVATQVVRTIVVKKVGHKINPVFATFGRFSFMPLWSGVFLLIYGDLVKDTSFYFYSITAGSLFALGQYFYFESVIKNNLSLSLAFFKTSVILVMILEIIFLKESFVWTQVAGVLLVVASVIYITISKDKNLKILETLKKFEYKSIGLGCILQATASILQRKSVLLSSPANTTFVNNIASALTLLLVLVLMNMGSKNKINIASETRAHLKDFFILGFMGFITVFAFNFATQYIPVTVASAITQLEIPLTLLYAYFFLGEKDLIKRNILPILALVIGIVMVVWR